LQSLWTIFLRASKESPRGFFTPAIALWELFVATAEGRPR
jgi:hypothetical protein